MALKVYQGAVFSDIDGTLVDEHQKIFQPTPRVEEAFRSLKEQGYLIGIATGRARCYIPEFTIDFDCYVSANGAVAEVDGKEIFNDTLTPDALREMISYMDALGIHYILESAEKCYYKPESETPIMHVVDTYQLKRSVFFTIADMDDIPAEALHINQLIATFETEAQLEQLKERFGGKYLIMPHRGSLSADICKKEISKATGIHAVLKHFAINKENTYAFGDHYNDLEMLGEVAHSVAMTPHADALDDVAEYITGSVSEDGIYWGLKHYGLVD